MSIEISSNRAAERIAHLEELERTWQRYEAESHSDEGKALGRRMAKAQREAIDAIRAGTTDALLRQREAEYQAAHGGKNR